MPTNTLKFHPAGPLFIGAFIDDACARKIADKAEHLLLSGGYEHAISLTPAGNLHFTYIFLGNEHSLPLNDIGNWWNTQCSRKFHGNIRIQTTATFGSRSTTIHLNGTFSDDDLTLRENMLNSLKPLDMYHDEKPFKAHLTIGRFRGEAKTGRSPLRREVEKKLMDGFGNETFVSVPPEIRLVAKNAETGYYENIF